MRKHIFTLMALAAALCACNKEQMIESEVTNPEVEPSAPLVFTATMEGAPAAKATFDNAAKCASWEVGDMVVINGMDYEAQTAGSTTMFSKVEANQPREIRPVFVSTTTPDSYTHNNDSYPPSNLVDAAGTETRWCAHTDHKVSGVWNIVVSTTQASILKTIKLWNADNQSYSGRRWKSIKVYGSSSSQSGWTELKSIENLNLAINNSGFAGEVEINATEEYTFYKVDVLENEGDKYMQMSDMKFAVASSPAISAPYQAYFPSYLYNNGKALLPSQITETWVDGKFNMPMYAHSETPNLQFKNLCGVLKIIVKSDQIAAVKRLRVSSNQSLSGYFKVENDGAKLTEGSGSVTVTYNEPVTTTAEGRVFYVAVPPQTYDYLKIELDADGTGFTKLLTTKKGQNIVVERNKIYPVNRAYDSAISVSVTNQVDGPIVSNLIMKNTGSQNIYLRSMIVAAWYDTFGNFAAPWDISQGTFESLAPTGWTVEDGIYYCDSAIDSEGCPAAPLFAKYTKPAAPAEGLHLEMRVMVQAIPYDSTKSCVNAFKSLN